MQLTIDRTVPLGLILNEVAVNRIEHAFGPGGGRIGVRLVARIGYKEAAWLYRTTARGINKPYGSGLNLIAALARQIGVRWTANI